MQYLLQKMFGNRIQLKLPIVLIVLIFVKTFLYLFFFVVFRKARQSQSGKELRKMVDQIFVFRSGKHNSQIDKSGQNRMLKPAVLKFGNN